MDLLTYELTARTLKNLYISHLCKIEVVSLRYNQKGL